MFGSGESLHPSTSENTRFRGCLIPFSGCHRADNSQLSFLHFRGSLWGTLNPKIPKPSSPSPPNSYPQFCIVAATSMVRVSNLKGGPAVEEGLGFI